MKHNVGTAERWLRIVLGLIVFSLFFIIQGGMRYVALIGLILIVTGLIRYCPLNALLGINTAKR